MKILLARMLYLDADIYFIDEFLDIFHSRKVIEIFEKIVKALLLERTIIFLSNISSYIRYSDYVYIFNEGRIMRTGTYSNLFSTNDALFWSLLVNEKYSGVSKVTLDDLNAICENTTNIKYNYLEWKKQQSKLDNTDRRLKEEEKRTFNLLMFDCLAKNNNKKKKNELTKADFKLVTSNIIGQYIKLSGITGAVLCIVLHFFSTGLFASIVMVGGFDGYDFFGFSEFGLFWVRLILIVLFIFVCHTANLSTTRIVSRYNKELLRQIFLKIIDLDAYMAIVLFKGRVSSTLLQDHAKVETRLGSFIYRQIQYGSSIFSLLIITNILLFPYGIGLTLLWIGGESLIYIIQQRKYYTTLTKYIYSKKYLQEVFSFAIEFTQYMRTFKKDSLIQDVYYSANDYYETNNYRIYDRLVLFYGFKAGIISVLLYIGILLFPFYNILSATTNLFGADFFYFLHIGLILLSLKNHDNTIQFAINNAFTAIFSVHKKEI